MREICAFFRKNRVKFCHKVWRRKVKAHPKKLKGSRYVLLKKEKNRTKTQDEVFKVIHGSPCHLAIPRKLQGDVSLPIVFRNQNSWGIRVEEVGVNEVMKIAQMFQDHLQGVGNALCHPQSNAKAERMNGKIQEVKTVGRGYRKFENFRSAILFFCGGLACLVINTYI